MELPKEIQIGGQVIKTQMCEELGGKLGKCCCYNGYIKIATNVDGCTQTDSSMLNTYVHECIHAILDTMGRSDLSNDETFVSTFAGFATEGIVSILKQNNKEYIMDYEKKYKEALSWMQSLYDGLHGKTKEEAETYFPELKESEDDKIISTIRKALESKIEDLGNGVTKTACLAWLEKQGEKRKITHEEICQSYGIPNIGEFSDGYHTFNGLYKQRMILFAVLVKTYKDKAWKSWKHEDGLDCFGGGWFIVGIDTPEGTYTYHYEAKDWDRFDCKILEKAKHWDGHDEFDVERLFSLVSNTNKDEVIRCLINGMKFYYEDNEEATWGTEKFSMKVKDILTWLEKQESVEEIVERCKTSWYNEGKIQGQIEGLTDDEKYQQGWHDALEKQGEQKPIETRTIGYWNVQEMITPEESLGISSEEWNKIEEECIFGNDKPKFKVGDWVVENEPNNYARFVQILDIVNVQGKERYRISRDIHNDEDIVEFNFVEKYYHHFNIQDAKDGDVLINWNNTVFIFKDIADETVKFHIAYNERWDAVKTPSTKFSHLGLSEPQFEFHPATKEQRELLFSKMKEAGYEWDAEKKELKKIELNEWVPQKGDVCRPKKGGNNIILCEQDGIVFSFVEDVKNGCAGGEISIITLLKDYELVEPKDYNIFDTSFSANDSELQEATYYIPEGFHAEIKEDKVVIKKGEYKPAWSEEDIKRIFRIKLYLQKDMMAHKNSGVDIADLQDCEDWLMELYEQGKDKLKPTDVKKKPTWSEEDEKRWQGCIKDYASYEKHALLTAQYIENLNWLKSLRPQK